MSYLVTARKWRPSVFDDMVGQTHVTTTLRNAIATNRLSHAYLFSGPRGVGKTSTARILAKAINCLHPITQNPDNECELCHEISEGRSVNVFEIDGASNRGVNEIRNLREAVRYGPAKGKYKVYIIDEVHMLTKEAFNALLKTLEEPPPYVIFIFATTEVHKLPPTILSRCQRFDFRRITIDEIIERLRFIAGREGITIADDALMLIAKRGDGSLRDAQSIFDQVVSFCGETITASQIISMLGMVDEEMLFRMTTFIREKDARGGLMLVDELVNGGFDVKEFLSNFTLHLRNLLVVRATASTKLIETSEFYRKKYEEESKGFSETDLLRLIRIASETESALRVSQLIRLKLEIAIMLMMKMDASVEISRVLHALGELRNANGTSPVSIPKKPDDRSPELPLSGSVRASQPRLRPDQMITGLNPENSGKIMLPHSPGVQSIHAETAALPSEEIPGVISADEIAVKWPAVVEEARKERIAVGTMLSEANLVDVHNNMLRIGCPDDFHLDGLRRNRQFLQDIAHRVYGAKVQLETIISRDPVQPSTQAVNKNPATDRKAEATCDTTGEFHDHPVVRALIREFGAEELG